MSKIAIVYHSGYGHTRAVAEHVVKGAKGVSGVEVELISAGDLSDEKHAAWGVLDAADGIVFGCPTYMGSVSAGLKTFFEATSGRWAKQAWSGKFAAGFTNSGSVSGDKNGTLEDIVRFASQHGMVWISPGILCNGREPESLNRGGFYLGVGTQSDQGKGPDEAPSTGDRETAEKFGRRVAELVQKFVG